MIGIRLNEAVITYGSALVDHPGRFGPVEALGLDEVLFVRTGPYRRQDFSTQLVDVSAGQLLDVVPGRSAKAPSAWLAAQDQTWRDGVRWATLDLSGTYRSVSDAMLPHAIQIADPFHVVKHANTKLDECRRRVHNQTMGHRGRKTDPLYRCRRLLTKADERLSDHAATKLRGLLAAGDPDGDVATAWRAKEAVGDIYTHTNATLAMAWTERQPRGTQSRAPTDRSAIPRAHPDQVETPHRGLAPSPRQQRPHRSHKQPDQEGETGSVRIHQLPQLSNSIAALCRSPRLGPTANHHTPLKSEAPFYQRMHGPNLA